jgi:hypothetical protein
VLHWNKLTAAYVIGIEEIFMTDSQARLLASAVGLVAGALAASTDNINVNIGLVIIIVSGAMFVTEYVRSRMTQ